MKYFKNIEEKIAAVILVAMISIVFLEVAVRPFGIALGYLTEIVPDLFVWLVMLGSAAAFNSGMHLSMSALTDKLPRKAAQVIFFIGALVTISFLLTIGISSLRIIHISIANNETNALGIPQWIMSAALPVGCFLGAIRAVQFMMRTRKSATVNN
ncbi:MAG: hypothetical protein DRI44_03070 [Chlamydiae bacterium]|nr:MAG: hypothetical protein DRI44_03070 [Chlamydiota bacterium]